MKRPLYIYGTFCSPDKYDALLRRSETIVCFNYQTLSVRYKYKTMMRIANSEIINCVCTKVSAFEIFSVYNVVKNLSRPGKF